MKQKIKELVVFGLVAVAFMVIATCLYGVVFYKFNVVIHSIIAVLCIAYIFAVAYANSREYAYKACKRRRKREKMIRIYPNEE